MRKIAIRLKVILFVFFTVSRIFAAGIAGKDPNLKLWLNFDGKDAPALKGAALEKGFSGLSATFREGSQVIDLGNPANGGLDLGTDDFTFALWIKWDKPGTPCTVFNKKNGNMTPGYDLSLFATGIFVFYFMTPYDAEYTAVRSKGSLADGLWHHIAVTMQRKGHIAMYLDGELDCTHFAPEALSAIENQDPLILGAAREKGAIKDRFTGQLDDFRLYRRELGAGEVRDIYLSSVPLSFQDDGKNVSVSSAGTGKFPSWKAVIDRRGGGDITGFHLPEGGENLSEGIFGMFYTSEPNRNGKPTKGGLHDQGKIDRIELIERTAEQIKVAVTSRSSGWYLRGPLGETVTEFRHVYTFTPERITCDGTVKWVYPYDTRWMSANLLACFRHDTVQFPILLTDDQGKRIELELSSSKGVNYPKGFTSPRVIEIWLKNGQKLVLRALELPALYRDTRHGGLERPWQLRNWATEVAIEGSAELSRQPIPQPLHYVWAMELAGNGAQDAPPIITIESPRRDIPYRVGESLQFRVSAQDGAGKEIEPRSVDWTVYKMYTVPLQSSKEHSFTFTVSKDLFKPEEKSADFWASVRVVDKAGQASVEYVKFHVENRTSDGN